ncbi:MAG: YdbC family protein [Eubacterium sp.]
MKNYNEKTDFSFDIRERLGVITEKKNGWKKELNIVCWNGREPAKFDIRDWSQDHSHMGRGVTLYQEELQTLVELYQRYEEAVREFDAAERCRKQEAARRTGMKGEYPEPAAAQRNASPADCGGQESVQDEEAGKQECGAENIERESIPEDLPPEHAGVMQQTAAESSAAAQI